MSRTRVEENRSHIALPMNHLATQIAISRFLCYVVYGGSTG